MNSTRQQTPQWALDYIHYVRENHLTTLDLGFSSYWANKREKLISIPNEVFALTSLQSLDLSGHQLISIPIIISRLVNLQWLNLSDNLLTDVPDAITRLTNLQFLDMSKNRLVSLPKAFPKLSNLQYLALRNNQLTIILRTIAQLQNLLVLDLSGNKLTILPDALAQLTKLQELHLKTNNLTTLPANLAELTNLRKLDLCQNWLTTLPDSFAQLTNLRELDCSENRLTNTPTWLVELPRLERLCLYENPVSSPPPEVLELKDRQPVNLEKLRAYFRQVAAGADHLFEAKLLIVGEPGAGKTSLTRKLLDSTAFLPSPAETTEGIDVHTWEFDFPAEVITHQSTASGDENNHQSPKPSILNRQFRVNIWDFGGQAIYHATHQFFLTRRSLYVVVADAREQKTDFYHWLDSIEHLSDASPVLILNNEKENRQWAINERQLHGQFANLKEAVFAFNLFTDHFGLERLRQAIQYHITHLPHVGDILPRTWVNVRHALEDDPHPHISLDQFLDICGQYGFTRREDKLQLSGYLHDLGVILHFQDDIRLKKTVILQPEWSTDAVYRVLDNELVKTNLGQFSHTDLVRIWNEEKYTDMHNELLALMMKFQLCYEIPGRLGQYIAPQLLGEQQPDYEWTPEHNLTLRYKYEEFMPRGLLTRFIVVMHRYIAGQQLVWRSGVVMEKDGTRSEVIEYYSRREIRIRVIGAHKRDLLTIVTHELDKLHHPFPRLKYDHLIPCNCVSCGSNEEPHFYRMEDLKIRLEHGRQNIECNRPPFHTVNIWSLIDDVGARVQMEGEIAFADIPGLLGQLTQVFSEEELRMLSLELGVEYDDLPAQGRENKARELILYMERRGRLAELVKLVQRERPHLRL